MTVFIIVVMLSLTSVFAMLSSIMRNTDFDWHNSNQITLYLKVPSTSAEEQQLMSQVASTTGVGQASLRSATDALLIMQDELGMHDILEYLSTNPLPAVIDVVPSSAIKDNEQLTALFNTLKSYENIDSAKMDMESIKRISLFLVVISKLFNIIIILVILALLLIIANALRLIISDRVEEISVLKFIGASNKFIRRPYLFIGFFYGLFSALLTIIVVNCAFINMREQINNLLSIYEISYQAQGLSLAASSILILISILVGWFGARFASYKYLRNF